MKKLLLGVGFIFLLSSVFALDVTSNIKEGVDYTLLVPAMPVTASVEPKGVVNVKEFFMFWCVHCKLTEPYVEQLLVPNKNIHLERIPLVAGENKDIINFGKLGATLANPELKNLNVAKLYVPVFNEVLQGNKVVTDLVSKPNALSNFLIKNGYNKAQTAHILEVYNSFAVNSQMQKYRAQFIAYNIIVTPIFIVADKYVVGPAQPERTMQVVLYLVNKVLQENKQVEPASANRSTSINSTKENSKMTITNNAKRVPAK